MSWKALETKAWDERVKPIPKGWSTAKQIAKELGISYRQAYYKIRDWCDSGMIESQLWTTMARNKTPFKTMIYRPKEKK